jgi:DNA replicative helicase MCM subunit Mcm2 (Cdc46/Mcm family)
VGSRYNPRLSIIDNIQLPPTLLSRFDLIYLVLDKADEATDRKLARHLVAMYHATPPATAQVPRRRSLNPGPDALTLGRRSSVAFSCKHVAPEASCAQPYNQVAAI